MASVAVASSEAAVVLAMGGCAWEWEVLGLGAHEVGVRVGMCVARAGEFA